MHHQSNRSVVTSGSLHPPPPFLIPDTNAASNPFVPPSPSDAARSDLSKSPGGGGFALQDATPLFPSVGAEDDQAWLFHPASVFDLPSEDYLNLHFGGALGPTSPPVRSLLPLWLGCGVSSN